MSQGNVEIVRRVYEALARGDWDALFSEAHPDFEMTTQRGPNAGTHRGRDGVQGFTEDYVAAFESSVVEPDRFIERGDQVLALVTRRARAKGGGPEVAVHNGHLWTIRAGKVASMKTYPDPNEALEAVGLRK